MAGECFCAEVLSRELLRLACGWSLSFPIHREQPQKLHSFFGLTFPLWAGVLPIPKFFSGYTYLYSLVFAYGIGGQDIEYLTRKSWVFVIHLVFGACCAKN
jgi:hypothetical protein